ncbi:MAG: hypothetical protein PHO65_02355 [Sulfurovum sp.]|nr:hypothetical protein [Sulfurovum sp.]
MLRGKKMFKIAPLGLAVIFVTACGNGHQNRDGEHRTNTASWPLIQTLEANTAPLHGEERTTLTVTQSDKENSVKKMTKQVEWIIAPEVWRTTKPHVQK